MLAALSAVVLVAAALWVFTPDTAPPAASPTASNETRRNPNQGSTAPAQSPAADQLVISIDRLGFSSVLDGMVVENSVVDPPTQDRVYLLTNHGANPSTATQGTMFIAMHSAGPGDYLVNRSTKTILARPGDVVRVGDLSYTVDSAKLIDRQQVSADSEIWDPYQPGKLVLITCMTPEGGGHIEDNVIITATLTSAAD